VAVIFLVTFECEDGKDEALVAALKRLDAVPVQDGVWLLETAEAAGDVRARLQRVSAKRPCRIFVGRLQGDYAYLNAPVEAADWLDDRDEWDFG
jgi:hypothetical protein